MSFPRYPKYKDSGVEWLGEVPAHWDVSRLGFESWVRARLGWKGLKAEEYVDDGFAFLSTPNIKGKGIDFENVNFITQERFDESPEIKVRAGDVLLTKDGSTLGTVNVVRDLPRPTTVNSSIAVITPNTSLIGIFLYYLFASSYMEQTIQRVKGGMGVPHLFQADLNKFYMPFPPFAEQTLIATFLDRETAKIDELVAEQRRLMELLKEKRQAVISHAVTQGLNPHAPMKPSGIAWLGDVPAHWCCVRNKVAFKEIDERSASDDGELMTVSHITGVTPRAEKEVNMFLAETLEGYKKCQLGDLVINTMWAWMGALGCSPCDGLVSPSYNVYRPRKIGELSPAYYDYLCRIPSHKVAIKANSTGVWESRLRLYPQAFLSMALPLPPVEEQLAIARHLDSETTKWDALTAEAQRAIDLLLERRTALISAAVTGQIDVRNVVNASRVSPEATCV